MSPIEVKVGEETYRIGRLDAFQQWHISRRLLPVAMAMGAAVADSAVTGENDAAAGEQVLGAFLPVAEALSKMSDADTEYVLNTCLSVCARQQASGWAAVKARGGGLMFEDIDMRVMMQLAMAVIREHRLADFMSALPTGPS